MAERKARATKEELKQRYAEEIKELEQKKIDDAKKIDKKISDLKNKLESMDKPKVNKRKQLLKALKGIDDKKLEQFIKKQGIEIEEE